ncbi:class I SAM-dependent methyltransferase [Mariniflexile ostreae]|uniref:Class I SAM-dependent methyltransferase n=1 Tax=Mariniflexile ostreae TaxID=1520892 RepID=A0ABV5FBD6_9FLAO
MKKLKRLVWYFIHGKEFLNSPVYIAGQEKTKIELKKPYSRTDVINYLLSLAKGTTTYLEIGVRNPDDNFNHINAATKYSVDPGLEFEENPVDFKITSDEFFDKLRANQILSSNLRFDVIFIDGLHYAEQVDRDIQNAMHVIKDNGFIVLHDCNPPTEWHARETFGFYKTPAQGYWNGTTWKAFLKWRFNPAVYSCCVDTNWGIGVLSKTHPIGKSIAHTNPFYEYSLLEKHRKAYLNLVTFDDLKHALKEV